MTELNKPVARKTILLLDNRRIERSRDKITVTLYPDRRIGFRAHKCRKEVKLDLAVVYRLALIEDAKQSLLIKQKEAKALGKRVRKPRRFSFLF